MRERGVGRLPRGLEEPREMAAAAHLSFKRALGELESVCSSLSLLRTIQLKAAGQREEAHGMQK